MERLHRTLPDEHFRVEGRRTWFETIEEMQQALDKYLVPYNRQRTRQGPAHERLHPMAGVPGGAAGGGKTNQTAIQDVQKATRVTPARVVGTGAEVPGDHRLSTNSPNQGAR